MELIFIRHGQPAWSVDGFTQPDPHLTPLGREQASLAAEYLSADPRGGVFVRDQETKVVWALNAP